MRVNSAFTGLFTHRLVVKSGIPIAIAMLAIFFTASSFTEYPDRDLRTKQANLMVRLIGHRLLLQSGDFTSRVLPVTEIKEGTFLLTFENEIVFNHDSLVTLTRDLFPTTQFPSGYTVTVHDCLTASIVYGFQINTTSPDILGCRGRNEPAGCYSIEIAFPDLFRAEEKKDDISQRAEVRASSKVDRLKASLNPEQTKVLKLDPQDTKPKLAELKSVELERHQANPNLEASRTTTFDSPFINLVYGGMVVLLGVALLIGRFGKILTAVPAQNQNSAVEEESVPDLPALGKFLFDVKGKCLLLGSAMTSLTDKECQVLELLNESFGELIPRETLMQKIWISEGVITGRSLDMFVSKLRKKLSGDPELRITNVHGKGYRLEKTGVQVL